jgi:two-component system sensor histidine kinase DesK
MPGLDDAALQGLSGPLRLAWSGVWLAFLGYPIGDIVSRHHSTAWEVAAWASLLLFVVLYLRTMWLALGSDLRYPRPAANGWLVALIVVTFAMVAGFGTAWAGLIIYLGVATGATLPNRAALTTLGGIAAVTVAFGIASGTSASDLAFVVFLTTALGVTMLGVRRMFQLIVELRDARDEVARLTAAEQRLRFARDLHDVLGHNLSAIALKSQVARRTLRSDPAAAAAALEDVEAVAHQSLDDVRALVSGYRPLSLDEELAAADELLSAAGVQPVIERPAEVPRGRADELLAWAVREGATNMVRHSNAAHCRITVTVAGGEACLEMADDGTAANGNAGGSGLRGLRERMTEAGGELHAGPLEGGGFGLRVRVPL